ncbi:MAG: ABC transporter substrate-binding protein [Alphaproteobacteria bacterium]|nr:ABC transporter substrate-binding protein [Alphaproteobacteria bacterium]
MKKFLIGLFVILCLFAAGYNAYRSKQQNTSDKKNVYAVLPISGPFTEYVKVVKETIKLWQEDHPNAPFQITYLDSESNPGKTVSMIHQMASDETHPLFITSMSLINSAILPVVERLDGFNFAITMTSIKPEFKNSHFQKMSHSGEDELVPILNYSKKFKQIALFYTNEEFGLYSEKFITKNLENTDSKVVSVIPIELFSLNNRIEVLKGLSEKPDAVLVLGLPTMGVLNIIRELHAQEYTGTIIVSSSFVHDYIVKTMENDMEGIIAPFIDLNQLDSEFKKKLTEHNININFSTAELYDVLNIIDYTFKNNLPFNQETYTKMGKWSGVAGDVTFPGNGDSLYPFILVQYKNGQFIPVEK